MGFSDDEINSIMGSVGAPAEPASTNAMEQTNQLLNEEGSNSKETASRVNNSSRKSNNSKEQQQESEQQQAQSQDQGSSDHLLLPSTDRISSVQEMLSCLTGCPMLK